MTQQRNPRAPVNVTDPAQKSENKKEEYKSKEWRQGNEAITDTTKGSGDRLRSSMRKKAQKQHGVAPPPPPLRRLLLNRNKVTTWLGKICI
jgi:hypothetical protein